MIDIKEKRVYCFPVEIVRAAEKEGIDFETLNDMVKRSARITHPQGNRRYNGWLFMVEGNDVLGFGKIQDTGEADRETPRLQVISSVDDELGLCGTCSGSKKIAAFDPCEKCDGRGCKYCDKGLVRGQIACPVCS